jgi:uncharacterized membrane protein YsdA (DUF1294 family)
MPAPSAAPLPPFHRRMGWKAAVFFVASLILPVLALNRLSLWVDFRLAIAFPVVVSLVAFTLYWLDKSRAESGGRRLPETTLHLTEFLGGWPGAFLAQRFLRHKSVKLRYQIVFWLIVALHQLVALDYLNDGRFSRDLLYVIKSRFS